MQFISDVFIKDEKVEWEEVGNGVRRKIMAYDDLIMLVKAEFQEGSIGPIHDHHHSQVTYVESGAFEVTIGKEKKVLKTNDAFYIPPHTPHGAVCLEEGVLLDVFSPIREDFMTAKITNPEEEVESSVTN